MRLDKFLKVSRIIKRRTAANKASGTGMIFVNEKKAKPALKLKIGDKITFNYPNKTLNIIVKNLNETQVKEEAEKMYEVL